MVYIYIEQAIIETIIRSTESTFVLRIDFGNCEVAAAGEMRWKVMERRGQEEGGGWRVSSVLEEMS